MENDSGSMPHEIRCALNVLEMVEVLHGRGYERLRIVPGMSPSGNSWRCSVTHAGNIRADNGAMSKSDERGIVHYTSAAQELYFDWNDAAGDGPEDLADKFIERFASIVRSSRGEDSAYVRWYQGMLAVAREGAFPVAYDDDYDEDPEPRKMKTTKWGEVFIDAPPLP